MSTRQRGQSSCVSAATSVRSAFAPQWEQNFAPTNIIPKQEGQATVASRAPQCSHCVESDEAAAPHIGQLSVSASIVKDIVPKRHGLQAGIAGIAGTKSSPKDFLNREAHK
jgi:hypothetical protein